MNLIKRFGEILNSGIANCFVKGSGLKTEFYLLVMEFKYCTVCAIVLAINLNS